MKILIFDNYDSFTYNLVQYVHELGAEVIVKLNDKVTLPEIQKINVNGIIFSPGPGTPIKPQDVGICSEIVQKLTGKIPILGVCLGHQLIGHLYGANVTYTEPRHGETSVIKVLHKSPLFHDIPPTFEAMRYHSLLLEKTNFPKDLLITAETKDGLIMAIEHEKKKLYGFQFHPESIGTKCGKMLIKNFLEICQEKFQERKF
jgi:anthranilate synthase component 2